MADADVVEYISKEVPEGSSALLTCIIRDELGVAVPVGSISTLKATLYDLLDATAIINSRDHQNVKNANDGTVDANGNFALQLRDVDNPVLHPTERFEWHVLLVEWTWGTGRGSRKELRFKVRNLGLVP